MSDNRNNISKYTLKADYSDLGDVRDFICREAKESGFDEEDSYLISLAVDEACTNLIRYAYKFDKNKTISITIEKNNTDFAVIIQDDGKAFNPLEVPPPDMQEYFDEFKRGGLGIFIIRKAMDEVRYKPAVNSAGRNELHLIKYLVK